MKRLPRGRGRVLVASCDPRFKEENARECEMRVGGVIEVVD